MREMGRPRVVAHRGASRAFPENTVEAFRGAVTLGADDRTLTDEDESKFLGKVRENCGQIGAELRG